MLIVVAALTILHGRECVAKLVGMSMAGQQGDQRSCAIFGRVFAGFVETKSGTSLTSKTRVSANGALQT
jgi:hypothetical protein